MQFAQTEVASDAIAIVLQGRLDTPGVDRMETPFTATAVGAGRHVVLDLSAIEFVGSMAIRMFITVAKAMSRKQHRLVLYAPQPLVREVLDTVSLNDIVPIASDRDSALATARG